jgi:hypothetical protein
MKEADGWLLPKNIQITFDYFANRHRGGNERESCRMGEGGRGEKQITGSTDRREGDVSLGCQ